MNKLALALLICCISCITGCCRKPEPEPESCNAFVGSIESAEEQTDRCLDLAEQDDEEDAILDATEELNLDCRFLQPLSDDTVHVYSCKTPEGESLTMEITRPAPKTCLPKTRAKNLRGSITL